MQDERLDVGIRAEEMTAEDLLDAIHKVGARIRLFHPAVMDMEQVFMRLTTGLTS